MTATRPPDPRIVYGARCVWWGSIRDAAQLPGGLPCCPTCRGVLFEYDNEAEWWACVARYEAEGHPGYRAIWEWSRGKCFLTFPELEAAYRAALAAAN